MNKLDMQVGNIVNQYRWNDIDFTSAIDSLKGITNHTCFTKKQIIATLLHYVLCEYDHTEGCGWYYFNFDDKQLDSSRVNYLNKSDELLSRLEFKQCLEIILILG